MTTVRPRITIVGLGPGDPSLRTVGVQQALNAANAIILRTRVHPGLDDLAADSRVSDCDDLYVGADRFENLYHAIAQRVIDSAIASGAVVFAVPGNPRFAERSVALVEAQARVAGIQIEVLDAVSFVDSIAGALHIDPISGGLQVIDAENLAETIEREPFGSGLLGLDLTRPVLVAQIYSNQLAVASKIALSRVYPEDHLVVLVRGAGIISEYRLREIPLHELDRQHPDHLTSLWVAPLDPLAALRSADSVARIVARLRAPGGCPWDREQTHGSLRNAVLAEAYEVIDAIDADDHLALVEELGDLLLLVMMHAQLAEEAGSFSIDDIYEEIGRKLIRRHPHVFGTEQAETPEEVVSTWEGVKAAERLAKGTPSGSNSRFARLPRSMPATRKAIEVLAPRTALSAPADEKAGDELLAAVSSVIERGIDPELALEGALRKRARSEVENQFVVADMARLSTKGPG